MSNKNNRLTKRDKMLSEISRLTFERDKVLNTVDFLTVIENEAGQKYVSIPVEGYAELASLINALHQAIFVITLSDANGVIPDDVDVANILIMLNQVATAITPLNELDDLDKLWQMQEVLS